MENQFYAGYDNNSFLLLDKFYKPTDDEINAFSSNTDGEIRFVEVNDVIFFCLKLGTMNWQDAPFTPHWYDPKPFRIDPPEMHGYMFQLSLVDSSTGSQVMNRIIGTSNSFARELHTVITSNYMKPFSAPLYGRKINEVYRKYTSSQLAEMAPEYQRYVLGTKDAPILNNEYYKEHVPEELKRWICTTPDAPGVVCVQAIPKCLLSTNSAPQDLVVPIPVKYVLSRGYEVLDSGYVCVEAPYDSFLGLSIPDEYYN